MSPAKRATCLLAAAAALALGAPTVASADPTVDAAVAKFNDLGLSTLTGMPSGRTTYRTFDQMMAELDTLAAAYPDQVVVKTAPYKSIEGRTIKYVEITNDVANEGDGKPVFFNMGAIHGNETPAAEDSIEFAYDVLINAKTNPKVKALLDQVRIIDMPIVNADGHVRNRRASCAGVIVAPATCATTGVDLNRNYPFGWGSSAGVNVNARGSGPGSEPEVKNTMEIVLNHQVVNLLTQHTNSRAIFYPGLEIRAGQTPDLNLGYRDQALAMAKATNDGYTNVRDSATDYETSGETTDWSYYATRGFAQTLELVGSGNGCPQALPNYLNCTTPDYTGTPGPQSTAAQTARFQGHPVRNAIWVQFVHSTLAAGHSQLKGTAVPGATLKITKDFNLYTAPIATTNDRQGPTTPPLPVPTHIESTLTVPASGQFTWDVNPSVRPVPAYRADGVVTGPNGFYQESYTISCTAADGRLIGSTQVLVDKGQAATVNPCSVTTAPGGGTVAPTLALTLGTPAAFGAFTPGLTRDYTAATTATVTSTAANATLTVADASANATGRLINGAYALPQPLQVAANASAFAPVGGSAAPTTLLTYTGPVSNGVGAVNFKQSIAATDVLRTGAYAKTLTFTLTTTAP
jgi:hypothetical protein